MRHQHARAGRNGHDRDHGRRGRQSQQVLDLRRRQSADGAGIRHERAVGKAGRRTLRTIDPYVLGRRGGHHHGGRRGRNERRRGRHAADIGVGVRASGDRGHRAWRTLSGLLEHGPRQHHSRRQGEAGLGSGFSCDARHQRDDAGQDRADTPRARSTTHLSLPLPEAPQEMRAQPPTRCRSGRTRIRSRKTEICIIRQVRLDLGPMGYQPRFCLCVAALPQRWPTAPGAMPDARAPRRSLHSTGRFRNGGAIASGRTDKTSPRRWK